ncbi:Hypothetical predicted protein [Paramuricea clavata]|uniref:Uncharacterized protein n=1 Tax=Paramuricea clavata TaxID=317549 RepID=A0A7D9II01_PARCT|nr:Hypothetical predicted protein [Paramuricea clavata]
MSKLEHEIAAICNTDEGANDLFRRLDEFIKNRQAMAKPVQMEKIFEQLKNVLKKGVKGPIKYENCLHIMAQISSANPEMFIDGETPQLIPFYTLGFIYGFEKMLVLKCSDKHESRRISVIGNVLEIVAAISDVSEDGKSAVVDFVLPCLNLLADKQQHITIRVEANRFLNGTIESFLRLNRDLDLPQLAFV